MANWTVGWLYGWMAGEKPTWTGTFSKDPTPQVQRRGNKQTFVGLRGDNMMNLFMLTGQSKQTLNLFLRLKNVGDWRLQKEWDLVK